jgi:hypothetical protein
MAMMIASMDIALFRFIPNLLKLNRSYIQELHSPEVFPGKAYQVFSKQLRRRENALVRAVFCRGWYQTFR